MRNRFYIKNRYRLSVIKLAAKRIAFLLLVCTLVYALPKSADSALSGFFRSVGGNQKLSDFLLRTGFGMGYDLNIKNLSPFSFFFPSMKKVDMDSSTVDEPENENENEDVSSQTDQAPAQVGDITIIPTTMTGEGSSSYDYSGGIYFNNKTDYTLDGQQLLDSGSSIKIDSDGPQVLIIHTHGSESYTPSGDDVYVESDPSRTEDTNYNMVRIGNELADIFEKNGIEVIHDTTLYDYPSYTGSYNRSLEAMEKYLEEYPSIKIVLDIHRDALEGEGTRYKTVAKIDGVDACSQIMLVVGTDYNGLEHPKWRENLAFATMLQKAASDEYPTLMRPLTVSGSRYNQHTTTGSLIIEVGTNGNTLQEALTAIRLFGETASEVILSLK